MSDFSNVDPVISGFAYTVTSVNGSQPSDLHDFVTQRVAVVLVQAREHVVQICGSARLDGDGVTVHEKTEGGAGKDVRTWSISLRDGEFQAIARSVF